MISIIPLKGKLPQVYVPKAHSRYAAMLIICLQEPSEVVGKERDLLGLHRHEHL